MARPNNLPSECTLVMRIILVKPVLDVLRMSFILSEDYRFTEHVSAGDLLPSQHQSLEHLVHCVSVE